MKICNVPNFIGDIGEPALADYVVFCVSPLFLGFLMGFLFVYLSWMIVTEIRDK